MIPSPKRPPTTFSLKREKAPRVRAPDGALFDTESKLLISPASPPVGGQHTVRVKTSEISVYQSKFKCEFKEIVKQSR